MNKEIILDPYEQEVSEYMDSYLEANKGHLGEWHEEEIASIIEAAKRHVARTKKTKQITLRIPEFDLESIKQKAQKLGMPYQTLIGIHLHQLATEQITFAA
jgi:predicted DNA binding CopG/RHH family protein